MARAVRACAARGALKHHRLRSCALVARLRRAQTADPASGLRHTCAACRGRILLQVLQLLDDALRGHGGVTRRGPAHAQCGTWPPRAEHSRPPPPARLETRPPTSWPGAALTFSSLLVSARIALLAGRRRGGQSACMYSCTVQRHNHICHISSALSRSRPSSSEYRSIPSASASSSEPATKVRKSKGGKPAEYSAPAPP